MRNFLLVLFLVPAIAALGHDIYFYAQHKERGFMLSDLGWLWDRYHKESHDQWKKQVGAVNEAISESLRHTGAPQSGESGEAPPATGYMESFTQVDAEGKDAVVREGVPEENTVPPAAGESALGVAVGFLLKQKAVFVFGGLALLVYIFSALFSGGTSARGPKQGGRPSNTGKKGGYKYKRK